MKTVYFLSEASGEFKRNDRNAFKEGSVYELSQVEETVINIFTDLEDARKELAKNTTYIQDTGRYIYVEEYALIERTYNTDEAIEEVDGISNEDEFVNALKKNPWDFNDYEQDYENIIDYSRRIFTAYLKLDDKKLEKEFNNYEDAKEWLDEQENKYIDDGILNDGIMFN